MIDNASMWGYDKPEDSELAVAWTDNPPVLADTPYLWSIRTLHEAGGNTYILATLTGKGKQGRGIHPDSASAAMAMALREFNHAEVG